MRDTFRLISIVIGRLKFSFSQCSCLSRAKCSRVRCGFVLVCMCEWVYSMYVCSAICSLRFLPLNMFLCTRFGGNILFSTCSKHCKQINYGNFMLFYKEMEYRSIGMCAHNMLYGCNCKRLATLSDLCPTFPLPYTKCCIALGESIRNMN